MRGLERGLTETLYAGLGINGPNGFQICRDLVQESPAVAGRREELNKKWERLNTASQELLHIGL